MQSAEPESGAPGRLRVSVVVISKDEPALAATLDAIAVQAAEVSGDLVAEVETVVVDASSGRLDEIRVSHPGVTWVDFERPPGVRISIPHQRNAGVARARGDVIVFTDCGCLPEDGWLARLLAPIAAGEERMTCGRSGALGAVDPRHEMLRHPLLGPDYLAECPTINLAFTRDVVNEVGPFDETFQYGSDVDFSWRCVAAGVRIRYLGDAVVLHDWGDRRRHRKRSFAYGKARARLYAKHVLGRGPQSVRKTRFSEEDLAHLAYPLFLLGLPLVLRWRSYLLVLAIPAWRNRKSGPARAVEDHLVQGAGFLAGALDLVRESRGRSG